MTEAPAVTLTLGLLAGAYRDSDPRSTLTHAVTLAEGQGLGDVAPLCGRAKPESICDAGAYTPAQLAAVPTCKTCARRDPRSAK